MNAFTATANGCLMRVQNIVERMVTVLRQLKDTEKLVDSQIKSVSSTGRGETEFDDVGTLLSILGAGKSKRVTQRKSSHKRLVNEMKVGLKKEVKICLH